MNLVATIIQPILIERNILTCGTILDCHPSRRYGGVSNVDSAGIYRRDIPSVCCNSLRSNRIQSFQIFWKPHFQVITSIRYHSDIVFRWQFRRICNAPDYIYLAIELFIDHIPYVTAILHSVVHSGNRLGIPIVIFIDDPINTIRAIIAIRAVYSICPFYNMDVSRSTILAINANMTIGTIGSVFTYRRNGNPIFAISTFYTNSPIDAISAVFALAAHGNSICLQILVQSDDQISLCIHYSLDVGRIIFRVRFRSISFDGHGTVQFFGHRSCISSKLQSII